MAVCAGRNKAEGTEEQEEKSNCTEQAGEVTETELQATIWWQEGLRKSEGVGTTNTRGTSSPYPHLRANVLSGLLEVILIFHFVTRNSIIPACKSVCSEGAGELRSDLSAYESAWRPAVMNTRL